MKVKSGAALILRTLCWSSLTSGIPRKVLERTRSVANTVPSYLNCFILSSVVGSLYEESLTLGAHAQRGLQ